MGRHHNRAQEPGWPHTDGVPGRPPPPFFQLPLTWLAPAGAAPLSVAGGSRCSHPCDFSAARPSTLCSAAATQALSTGSMYIRRLHELPPPLPFFHPCKYTALALASAVPRPPASPAPRCDAAAACGQHCRGPCNAHQPAAIYAPFLHVRPCPLSFLRVTCQPTYLKIKAQRAGAGRVQEAGKRSG